MVNSQRDYYKTYYVNQAKQRGGSLPAFHGAHVQQGYGLGSVLRGLFRWAMPHVSTGAKILGRQALKGGLAVAQDVSDGKDIKESIKNRTVETGGRIIKNLSGQTGRGKKTTKRKNQSKLSISRPAKKQRTSPVTKQPFNFF